MKIALIGLGSVGKRHLKNLMSLGHTDLVIVSSHKTATEYSIDGKLIPVVIKIEDIINDVDAMVVANTTDLHKKNLELAIEHKVHAYIEKPVGCDASGFEQIREKATDIIISVGTQFRFNKNLMKLKELLAENKLGEVMTVMSSHGEHIADYHPGEDYRKSYAANKSKCGGVLLTQIHHIDYLQWLFGKFTHAYATEKPAPSLGIEAESIVNYSLVSEEKQLHVHGHMNYLKRPKSTTLYVAGELGTANWNYDKNSLKVTTDTININEKGTQDRNQMFVDSISDFLNAINNSQQPRSNLDSGINALQIVDSIKRSILSGQVDRICSV